MYKRHLLDLLTSTNHEIYTVNTVLDLYKQTYDTCSSYSRFQNEY